jgi:hypothetical protein
LLPFIHYKNYEHPQIGCFIFYLKGGSLLAKTLKKLCSLQQTIARYNQDIQTQQNKIQDLKRNYILELEQCKVEKAKTFDSWYDSFRGRPYLLASLLAALLIIKIMPGFLLLKCLFLVWVFLVLVLCIKPLGRWLIAEYSQKNKPERPYFQINGCYEEIQKIQEEIRKYSQGLQGEEYIAALLEKHLPDDFYVINDIFVPTRNRKPIQIDHVVIGPNGVTAIETKNISGNYYPDEKGWLRYPAHTIIGIPCSNYYHEVIPSPQKQSWMQADALMCYLREKSFNENVHHVVVLTNPECAWQGEPGTGEAPVVYKNELIEFIETRNGSCSAERAREIAHLLKRR